MCLGLSLLILPTHALSAEKQNLTAQAELEMLISKSLKSKKDLYYFEFGKIDEPKLLTVAIAAKLKPPIKSSNRMDGRIFLIRNVPNEPPEIVAESVIEPTVEWDQSWSGSTGRL